MNQTELDKRTEWLEEFNAAQRHGRYATRGLRDLAEAATTLGNDGLAEKLNIYADVFKEVLEVMDNAVSRSIQEDFEDSQKQIGETFKTLLEVAAGKDRSND